MKSFGPSWIGRSLNGRYQIESILGRGGMSSVYRAQDPNLRRKVAVKIIHQHLTDNPEFIQRFEQEAALVAQLRHTNIVQVHDFNHDGDVYYMVLEYVAGETLARKLEALNSVGLRLPLADIVRIMATICDAVDYAHQRRMIHRDLKPANVMINLLGEAVLMDFGIAKIMGGQPHTATGAAMGTAAYMSPEQVQGDKADHRADIYSLGIIMYEMLGGETPFHGDSTYQVMLQHVNEPVPDIRLIDTNVPGSLAAILEKALAKDPDDRYQTAAAMADALRTFHRQLQRPADALTPLPEQWSDHPGPGLSKNKAWLDVGGERRLWLGVGVFLVLLLVGGGLVMRTQDSPALPATSANTATPPTSGLVSGVLATPMPTIAPTTTALPLPTTTSTPNPTATLVPAATAMATPTLLHDAAIALEPSSIFIAPDAGAQELAIVAAGETVSVLGRSESGNWLFVLNDDFVPGFVFVERFDWDGDFEALPLVTPVPLGDSS